ncbi:hydroxyacid dehydrogenase [Rhizobium leguminosarum]|uniref:Hydroxyacid dehydrogenase n=1 Tax=Rhizobium leguminosarum TaxID=384 RepID=A0A444I7D8_RHILE|nr:NAD(P)-dependent oxidoreductase [Rhizobium leguminosarum]RWX34215.1 hydroxyacid dehydrogenase [Rhizobium leguminosarum]
MNIVLCGTSFPDVAGYLKEALPSDFDANFVVWNGDLKDLPGRCDVMIPMMQRVDATLIDRAKPSLIQQWGSGLEGVDIAHAQRRGVAVANVAADGGNADSVAEHAILLTLALLRRLREAENNVHRGTWGAPVGVNLAGRSVCIYGLGAIALPLARRLKAFDVRLLGCTRDPKAEKVSTYGLDKCFAADQVEEALAETDILIVCLRQSQSNANAVGERELRALPKGALVVNVARGGLIDYAALSSCLADGHLGGVGLDVFWREPFDPSDPILNYSHVVATPHIAGITSSGMKDIARGVADNIVRLATGDLIENRAA